MNTWIYFEVLSAVCNTSLFGHGVQFINKAGSMTFLLPILESCDWANGWSCDKQPVRKIIIKCLVVKILKIDFKENLPQNKNFLSSDIPPCTCCLMFYISFYQWPFSLLCSSLRGVCKVLEVESLKYHITYTTLNIVLHFSV